MVHMLKRLAVAFGIFVVSLAVLMLPTVMAAYRNVTRGNATGLGFATGSASENVFRVLILLLLAFVAFWLSGKLVRV